jgi:hypothetical protein
VLFSFDGSLMFGIFFIGNLEILLLSSVFFVLLPATVSLVLNYLLHVLANFISFNSWGVLIL